MSENPTPGTVLLTGPTGGLGRALLEPLARRRPAHLVLLGRSAAALADAADTVQAAGGPSVSTVEADLADLDRLADAAERVTERLDGLPPLTALVLSAGVQMRDRAAASRQGIEMTFAVNVVAQHQLLRALVPAAADGATVTLLGSGTHYGDWHSYRLIPPPVWAAPDRLATPDPTDTGSGSTAYATSKLGVLYLAHAWQRRARHLRVNVFDPLLMPGTGLARDLGGLSRWAWHNLMPAFTLLPGWSTPRRSAESLTALALGERHADLRGGYVEGAKERRSSAASYDVGREDELLAFLDGMTRPGR